MNECKQMFLNYKKSDCVRSGTRILSAFGDYRPIEDIKIGEKIMGANGVVNVVENIVTGYEQAFILLNVGKSDIYVTKDHLIMTVEGWKCAEELQSSDKIVMQDGSSKNLLKLTNKDLEDKVYSLCLAEMGTMICEDVVMADLNQQHNILRQKMMSNRNKDNNLEKERDAMIKDMMSSIK